LIERMQVAVSRAHEAGVAVTECYSAVCSGVSQLPDLTLFVIAGDSYDPEIAARVAMEKSRTACGIHAAGALSHYGIVEHGITCAALWTSEPILGPLLLNEEEAIGRVGDKSTADELAAVDAGRRVGKLLSNNGGTEAPVGLGLALYAFDERIGFFGGMYDAVGPLMPLLGGRTVDRDAGDGFLFGEGKWIRRGILTLGLQSDKRAEVCLRHGWRPVGRPVLVTQSWPEPLNLDGYPAWDTYAHLPEREHKRSSAGCQPGDMALDDFALQCPLGVPVASDRYLTYDVRFAMEEGESVCWSRVPEGSLVRIMSVSAGSLQNATAESVRSVCEREPTGIAGLIGVSCITRRFVYGQTYEPEQEAVKSCLSDNVPYLVIPAFGELGPIGTGPLVACNKTVVVGGLPWNGKQKDRNVQ